MTIASLQVEILANTVSLVKGVAEVHDQLDKVESFAKKAGAAIAGAFTVTAIIDAGKRFIELSSNLTDLSQKTGITTSELQRLDYAAKQNGGSLDQVTASISKMEERLGKGDAGAAGALAKLGLSFSNIRTMDPGEAFLAIGDAIGKVQDPAAQSALAVEIFGKSGAENLKLFNGNLKETADWASKMGLVVGDDVVAAGDKLGDTIATIVSAGITLVSKVVGPLLPLLQQLAEGALVGAQALGVVLGDAINLIIGLGKKAIDWIVSMAEKVADFAMKIPGASAVVSGLSTAFGAVKDAAVWVHTKIGELNPTVDKSTDTLQKNHRAHLDVSDAAKEHAKAIQAIIDKLTGAGAIKEAADYQEALGRLGGVTKLSAIAFRSLGDEAAKLRDAGVGLTPSLAELAHVHDLLAVAATNAKAATAEEDAALNRFNASAGMYIKSLPTAIFQTRSFAGSVQMVSVAAAGYRGNLAYAQKATEDWFGTLTNELSRAFSGAGGFVNGLKNLGTGIAKDFVGGMLSFIPGIGPMLSQLAGPIVSGVKKLFGSLFGGGTAGRDAVTQFASTFGGFDALHTKLLALGNAGEQLWVKFTQGVGRNNPEQAKAVIEEINAALKGQDDWMSRLPGLIDKYGLSWADAGHAAKQAHLDEIAQGLIQDFADLSKAGFDVSLITDKMSTSINDYIHEAMLTGTEVPAALRPLLQKMIDLGDLTDVAGNKLDDLSSISFAETLTEGFHSVVDAINELTRALTGNLSGALDELSRRKVVIPISFEEDNSAARAADGAATGGFVGSGRVIPFPAYYGRGGFVPRGRDTVPAMLEPGEVILNAAQQRNVAGQLGGGDHITISAPDALRLLHGEIVKVSRKDAARGGSRPRAAAGRSS